MLSNKLRPFGLALTLILCVCSSSFTSGCTIFVLTDPHHTLFFNNEDYTNPTTRIWFIPAGKDFYGCAFVGFNDGSAQGGINTEGLAFDWYAGGYRPYEPSKDQIRARGNSSERMLESCATVDEAIRFYQLHAEPSFANASLLIADQSGASVIIRARDGQLSFDRSDGCRALGFGASTFERMYAAENAIDLSYGADILKSCVQTGDGGTKYSNVYDLKTGEITFLRFTESEQTTLNIFTELAKGPHYYDIPHVERHLKEPIKPLLLNMTRLCLYEFQPLEDQEPAVTTQIKEIITDAMGGTMKPRHYARNFWSTLEPEQENIQTDLQKLGKIESLHLVQKTIENELTIYSYVIIYQDARTLFEFTLDEKQKTHNLRTLKAEIINSKSFEDQEINRWRPGILLVMILLIGLFTLLWVKRKQA